MKASELIELLKSGIEQYGDLPVNCSGHGDAACEVEYVTARFIRKNITRDNKRTFWSRQSEPHEKGEAVFSIW